MKAARKIWDAAGWLVTGYAIYRQLKGMNEIKNEYYLTLSPEQQAQWDKVFGKPGATSLIPTPSFPQVLRSQVVSSLPTNIEQVVAGT